MLRGGLGDLRAAIFEEAVHFGEVLRFEAGIFAGSFVEIGDVLAGTMAEGGIFEADIPKMAIFFHFVAFVLDAQFFVFAFLRFEAIFSFASFGAEF